jgi:hypothetical protein
MTEPGNPGGKPAPSRADIAYFEARAEEAYDAMYEVVSYGAKDCRDDALIALSRAIAVAEELGLPDEVERLRQRRAHIDAVYQSQFRGF